MFLFNKIKKVLVVTVLSLFCLTTTSISTSYAKTVIRDAEIEAYIKSYSRDIFKAAILNPSDITIFLIEDESPNAFVAGGMNIFIHTGLIEMCETPEELIGVIAHETAHIAGGHLARIHSQVENSKNNVLYSLLLATVVGLGSKNSQAGTAILAGGTETSKRGLLHYSRTQESVADSNAIRYLEKNNISSKGLLSFMEKLEKNSLLPESSQAEYLRTHPLSKNRIEIIKNRTASSNKKSKKLDRVKFDIIKNKIYSFLNPRKVLSKIKQPNNFIDSYSLVIANYKTGNTEKAIEIIDILITEQKNNPYLHELKGEILRNSGQINKSILAYKEANKKVNSALIKIELAKAMSESNNPLYDNQIIDLLNESLRIEKNSLTSWKLLAKTYKKQGNEALFRLSQAEADLLTRDFIKAKFNSKRAENILKEKQKTCQRCKDIVSFIEKQSKTK
ncbi:MAG: M48 family metalloprotease [Alphaproteobacteria bacterium]|nr:M48 family metalloprotease [Alphaproteobacteria bacterium]